MASALRVLHPTAFMIRSGLLGGSRAAAAAGAGATSTGPAACARTATTATGTASNGIRTRFPTAFGCRGGTEAGITAFTSSFTTSSLAACAAVAAVVAIPKSRRCGWACSSWEKRSFSGTTSSAAKELVKTINSEIQHEQSTYEADGDLRKFLQTSGWELTEQENDMMVTLKKEVAGKKVVVEFSCVQNAEAPSGEEGPAAEMSDFTVTVTKAGKDDGEGITFYCSTTQDEEEKFRYCVGQVRLFKSAEEKESLSVYPGPYFEDLDDAFQQCLGVTEVQYTVVNDVFGKLGAVMRMMFASTGTKANQADGKQDAPVSGGHLSRNYESPAARILRGRSAPNFKWNIVQTDNYRICPKRGFYTR
eukprot:XP_028343974.1 uncharacterized protein LOC112062932 [Physeter catodon]